LARVGAALCTLLLALQCLAAQPRAQTRLPVTREQALQDLRAARPALRREAAARLADVGTAADVSALIKALRDNDSATRRLAESSIWRIWSRSGNVKIDRLFARGVRHMNRGEADAAIATFSEVIRRKPSFAEGWNKRATVYFLIGEYRKSLSDCDEVIKRNPQHFGALAGYGQIHVRLEQPERALGYFRRALDINPNMAGVARAVEELEAVVRARRARSV
jgi:tetratricopeptide (TPR) repeat protein